MQIGGTGRFRKGIKDFLKGRFDLRDDNASQNEVVERIESGVVIRGTNLWVLIFATFIASLGLNVNSTAVIIGAMLISPLMGPIMGLGVALGISDFALLKRSLKNFCFMALISILTSTIYFLISPLTIIQSELLARTQPTTWDVLIAFFGGLAGMIAQTRNDRFGTVIPGVAIATALMPPLCTAGFGLATGQFSYFIGAIYLFIINTVFIGLSSLLIVNFLKYKKVKSLDKAKDKRVRQLMAFIIFVTIAPSVYIGFNLVRTSMFEHNVSSYVVSAFKFEDTQVVDFSSVYNGLGDTRNSLEVAVIGEVLAPSAIEALSVQMKNYGIYNTDLIIKQSGEDSDMASTFIQTNFEQLIKEKNFKINLLDSLLNQYKGRDMPSADISREVSALFNTPLSLTLSQSDIYDHNGNIVRTVVICYIDNEEIELSYMDRNRLLNWLRARTKFDDVRLFFD